MNSESNKAFRKDLTQDVNEQEGDSPSIYQVVIHNDEFTPKDFVIDILEKFFFMDKIRAKKVMLEAHVQGKASCGAFSKDYAESKVSQVVEYSRGYEHPLICSSEAGL